MLLHQRLVRELAQCGQVGGNRRLGFRLQPFRRRNRVFPPILRPGTPFSRAGVCDAGPAKATFCLEIAIGKPKHSDFGLICGVYNVFGRVSSPGPGSESLCSRRHSPGSARLQLESPHSRSRCYHAMPLLMWSEFLDLFLRISP